MPHDATSRSHSVVERPRTHRWRRLAAGLLLAGGIARGAARVHALSPDGATAATLVGAAVHLGAGLRGSATLVAYFVTSSLLGRLPTRATHRQQRGNRRDAVQVFANGFIPAALALAAEIAPARHRSRLLAAFAGAVATAAADTWATEIGTRSGQTPRSIATRRPLAPGASGGVTGAGLVASLAGATLIGLLTVVGRPVGSITNLLGASVSGGVIGSLADSLLGATLQAGRYCDRCQEETELPVHSCGTPTRIVRGASWCNNDMVNAIALAIGAATTVAVQAAGEQVSSMTPGERACSVFLAASHKGSNRGQPAGLSRRRRVWQGRPERK